MADIVLASLTQGIAGLWLLRRLARFPGPGVGARPGISILKPLCGTEPMLEAALASVCRQDYPTFQIIFGLHSADDPALAVVNRIQARFPESDIAVVVDTTQHGSNRKIGNLLNMLAVARHDTLVIADSDVHVAPDWLESLSGALQQPGVGLATSLYTGLAANPSLAARLGAMQISHCFLPGAVIGRALGRQDCLGANVALRRSVLTRIGGLEKLRDELADDAVLGRLVTQAGLKIALAPTLPATSVPESRLPDLWRHELRWARTIRALEPMGQLASLLQYPIAWATLALLLSGLAPWSIGMVALTWVARAAVISGSDAALRRLGGIVTPPPFWLLPLRDLLSVALILASFTGSRVEWRGQVLRAHILHDHRLPGSLHPAPRRLAPGKG